MATKVRLDPLTDKPTKKGDITKNYMVRYAKAYGTPEQRAELKQFIKEHTVEKESKLTHSTYKDIELKACREKFCELFFPELVEKKGKRTFFEEVEDL